MNQLFELDFDKMREAAAGRHLPLLPITELEKSTQHYPGVAEIGQHQVVRRHATSVAKVRVLKLLKREVRAWLRTLRFTSPPLLTFGVSQLPCGRALPDAATVPADSYTIIYWAPGEEHQPAVPVSSEVAGLEELEMYARRGCCAELWGHWHGRYSDLVKTTEQ